MTHQDQSTRFGELLQLLSEQGVDGLAEAIQILMKSMPRDQKRHSSISDSHVSAPSLRQTTYDSVD
jgi:hypothetical protein